MLKGQNFNTHYEPTWCPGCGDFGIWTSLKNALDELGLNHHEVVIAYGIGCSGNMANTVKTYAFHGLHGRPIPVAEGIKLANHGLTVIVIAGDGDTYGEGMNHFITSMRGNHDITVIVHDNQVYGLTTGQTSPTSEKGYKSKSTPSGVIEEPVNPVSVALAMNASFISRGFSGNTKQLTELIKRGIQHKGFSLVDALQPCVTFNKINTFQWFYRRVYELDKEGYQPNNWEEAMKKAREMERLATGVFYVKERLPYHEEVKPLEKGPLMKQSLDGIDVRSVIKDFS
ncbi:2-oxoacid:ferredoxin oxidoreductase subunit beta [Patescibacteria group bacterium]